MNKYLDCELYQVELDEDGNKRIHIDGYCYDNGDSLQLVQFTFCYVTIDEMQNNEEAISEAIDWTKQYYHDIDGHGVDEYYNGIPELAMTDVDEDTPCGWYIDPTFKGNNANTIQQL